MDKLVIIGLDGGTFNIIDEMPEDELPFLKGLINNGVKARLKSTCIPFTAPAWTSLYTGVNPGKHGICSWKKAAEGQKVIDSTQNKYPYFWDLVDKRVILVHLPVTYPPKPLKNGILITGYPTPYGAEYAYPPHVKQEIEKMGLIPMDSEEHGRLRSDKKRLMEWMFKSVENTVKLFSFLLTSKDWEIAFLVISNTDWICHLSGLEDAKRLYAYTDRCLGNVLGNKDYTYLVVSDHGFQKSNYTFYLNDWLKSEGLLNHYWVVDKEGKQPTDNSIWRKLLMTFSLSNLKALSVLKSLHLEWLKYLVPSSFKNSFPKERSTIDWDRTTAYLTSGDPFTININLKGRESHGIVDKKDYESTRESIIQKLRALKNPYTHENVLKKVIRAEEVLYGENLAAAPDVICIPADDIEVDYAHYFVKDGFLRPNDSCRHAVEGIFIACGESIKNGVELDSLEILDIAPTIIHMMGGKIPLYMDGKVRLEIFKADSGPFKREIQYEERSVPGTEGRFQYTEEEAKEIEQSLKDLGYL